MGSSSDVVVGYRYYLGMHMVLCYGPIDRIEKIVVGDRVAHEPDISSSGQVYVDAPELFGGDEREGGIQGYMDVSFGDVATANDYLTSQLGDKVPAYRGVVSLILRKMHLTSMNPYIKPWMTKVKRTMVQTDGSPQWYSGKADIGGQCNPAHIVREVLTNSQWGMGYPETSIADASFTAAADALYAENFGMFMKWSSAAKIKDVISEIQKTADCILYQGASDGKFRLKMIRDDYDTGTLPAYDETNIISFNKYEHKGWGETINEVTVEYTDVDSRGEIKPVTVQDLGNIQMQGTIIPTTKKYHGVTNATLATKLAQRDLRVLTVPLASIQIVVNRTGWDLGIGDVIKVSWAKYGLVQGFYRILKISKGTLTDGKIKIDAIEDVFGLPDTVYIDPQPPQWSIPNNPPAPVVDQMAMFTGFWDVSQKLPQANIDTLDPDFAGAIINATVATTDTYNYRIYATDKLAVTGSGSPSAYATLDVDIDHKTKDINVRNGKRLIEITTGPRKYIAINDEMMRLDGISVSSSGLFAVLSVSRGALDTVPTAHSLNDDVWFPGQYGAWEDTIQRTDGETPNYKLLPRTGYGTFDPSDGGITPLVIALYDRYQRPYPPGYLEINGEYLASSTDSNIIVMTWQHRNRLLETANIICKEDDNGDGVIDPDDRAVRYWIDLEDENGTRITDGPDTFPHDLGTALTYTYDNQANLHPQLTVLIWAEYTDTVGVLGPVTSWQKFTHTFLTAGGHQHSQLEHTTLEHL